MCFHTKKNLRQEESRKKRNELAGMILNIREQTDSLEIKEKLLGLEKLLMEFRVNSRGTGTYGAELTQLLMDFPSVLQKGIDKITDNYLNRMRDRITRWQQQGGIEEDPQMLSKIFGRKKAKEDGLNIQREKCERNIFCLEQKNTELAMKLDQVDKEKKDFMLQAAKCEPGSREYDLIKQKYNRKVSDADAAATHKALVQKALNSNYDYLNIINTGRDLIDIKGLMPPSPEEIELEVQKNIAVKSNMVDEFDKAQEIMRYGKTQLQDMSRETVGASLSDPFDAAVNEIREADHGYRAILGEDASLVDEMRKQAADQADIVREEKQ
jgi:hypothetical protein